MPLSDVKSVQAHQDAQQHLTPIIEVNDESQFSKRNSVLLLVAVLGGITTVSPLQGIEEKLAKLQEVYQTIAKDCNPIDAKRLETKISDLKQVKRQIMTFP